MAYVPVPKDLTKVKTKVMFNLTKRQLICFGTGILIGAPLFFLLLRPLGSSTAAMCMMLVMLPFFHTWLGMGVWDYSTMPGNIMGQVCPQFLVMWVILAAVGIVMLDWMRYGVEGGERPRYTLWRTRSEIGAE